MTNPEFMDDNLDISPEERLSLGIDDARIRRHTEFFASVLSDKLKNGIDDVEVTLGEYFFSYSKHLEQSERDRQLILKGEYSEVPIGTKLDPHVITYEDHGTLLIPSFQKNESGDFIQDILAANKALGVNHDDDVFIGGWSAAVWWLRPDNKSYFPELTPLEVYRVHGIEPVIECILDPVYSY